MTNEEDIASTRAALRASLTFRAPAPLPPEDPISALRGGDGIDVNRGLVSGQPPADDGSRAASLGGVPVRMFGVMNGQMASVTALCVGPPVVTPVES